MKYLLAILSIIALSSCSHTPNKERITANSLLSASSERVSFGLIDRSAVSSLKGWISDDKPSEAILSCVTGSDLCTDAKSTLEQNNIPFSFNKSGADSVTLIYSRIAAHDCDTSRFGCSTAVNSLQMISDRKQFVSPSISDRQNAGKAVIDYEKYLAR